jgi:hypothetical protein
VSTGVGSLTDDGQHPVLLPDVNHRRVTSRLDGDVFRALRDAVMLQRAFDHPPGTAEFRGDPLERPFAIATPKPISVLQLRNTDHRSPHSGKGENNGYSHYNTRNHY